MVYLYLENGKILSAKSQGKDVYYIPDVKRELGENDVEALVREVKEELSVTLDFSILKYYNTFEAQAYGKEKGIIVKMTCYTGKYSGTLIADSEIEEIAWLSYKNIHKVSPVDKILFKDLFDKGLLLK